MDSTDEYFEKHKLLDLFSFFFEHLFMYGYFVFKKSMTVVKKFAEKVQLSEFLDVISEKLSDHPIAKLVAIATALSCGVPIVMFIVFGLVSVVVTFAGFLFIEGTLLAVGGFCMFACIALMMMVMSIMAATVGVLYLVVLRLGAVLNRFESTSSLLRTLAPTLVNGNVVSVIHDVHDDAHPHQHQH